jgi:hypothetical protein
MLSISPINPILEQKLLEEYDAGEIAWCNIYPRIFQKVANFNWVFFGFRIESDCIYHGTEQSLGDRQ